MSEIVTDRDAHADRERRREQALRMTLAIYAAIMGFLLGLAVFK